MPKTANKPLIAVDIDDVLAVFAEEFVKYSNHKWGTNLHVDDYTEHWSLMWQIDKEATNERAKEWYESGHTASLPPKAEAAKVLKQLSQNYDLVIITSRHGQLRQETEEWIMRHYPNLFKEVHFAGIWEDQKKSHDELIKVTKADLCNSVGASYLIDDQPKHCEASAQAGIKAILFGEYSWNRDAQMVPNMSRAKNWQEVLEFFNAKSR